MDYLCAEELRSRADQGIVDVRPAYSATPDGDVSYVQDRLWVDRADVTKLTRDADGATFYVCGDGQHMAPAVRDTCVHIYQEGTGVDEQTTEAWPSNMQREHSRYVADVFS